MYMQTCVLIMIQGNVELCNSWADLHTVVLDCCHLAFLYWSDLACFLVLPGLVGSVLL